MQEVLDSGLLNEHPDWFVAGGFAADPNLASDVDVWIRVDDVDELYKEHARLQQFLDVAGFQFERLDNDTAPELFDAERLDTYGANEWVAILKVATVKSWRGIAFSKPVHLLVTTGTVEEVLANFDISTHAVAFLPNGQFVYDPQWTPKNVDPVVMRDTPTTPARFVKIRTRYARYRSGAKSVFAGGS